MVEIFERWVIRINCDLCGRVDERLYRTLIEEVELNVCSECSKFGKVLAQIRKDIPKKPRYKFEEREEKIELIVDNYADIIKRRRESMGLTQKDFANRINEKESTIHKIETNSLEPSFALAKKLEKFLDIKLIEGYEERRESAKKGRGEGFTLGDFINAKSQK